MKFWEMLNKEWWYGYLKKIVNCKLKENEVYKIIRWNPDRPIELNNCTIIISKAKYLFEYDKTEVDFKNCKFISSKSKNGARDFILKFSFNGATFYDLNKITFSQEVGYPITFVDYAISLKMYSLVKTFMKFRLNSIIKAMNKIDWNNFVNAFSDDKIALDERIMPENELNVKTLYENIWWELFAFLKIQNYDWGEYINK